MSSFISFTLFFLFGCAFSLESLLRFRKIENAVSNYILIQTGDQAKNVKLDGVSDYQVRVIIKGVSAPKISFYCKVGELDPSYPITTFKICEWNGKCYDVNEIGNKFDLSATLSISSLDTKTGFVADVDIDPGRKKPVFGTFYCKLENDFGFSTSSSFELEDVYFYNNYPTVTAKNEAVNYVNWKQTVTSNDLPKQLSCGDNAQQRINPDIKIPLWLEQEVELFDWRFVGVDGNAGNLFGLTVGGDPHTIQAKVYDSLVVTEDNVGVKSLNGTVTLNKVPKLGYGYLVCTYKKSYSYAIYGSKHSPTKRKESEEMLVHPIKFDTTNKYSAIHPISSLKNSATLREGPYTTTFKLTATYRGRVEPKFWHWEKDGKPLNKVLYSTQNEYFYKFPKKINYTDAGVYSLVLKSGSAKVRFTYNVSVISPPEKKAGVNNNMPKRIFKMDGDSTNVECDFQGLVHKKTLLLNGVELASSNENADLTAKLEQFKIRQPELATLKVSVNPLPFKPTDAVKYTVHNLRHVGNTHPGQSHILTCRASNDLGVNILSTVITVLRKPVVIHGATESNCTKDCSSQEAHNFTCQFKDIYSNTGVIVKQTWYFGNLDLSDIPVNYDAYQYFRVHDNGATLAMRPLNTTDPKRDQQFMKAVEKEKYVRCALILKNPDAPDQIIYDTPDHGEEFGVQLRAYISLEGDIFVAASLNWIAGVVAAIVVILLCILFLCCLLNRDRGRDYNVDEKERAQGNDPEKELKEEEFKAYERPEEPPLPGRRLSMNNGSIGVGSDDDGELDDYNLDPGKFNEEGSFIGEYASDSRRNTRGDSAV